ncbi:hypothetical protein G9A89_011048 [Geosiphon pyriformis]|nr:hypothetical protein G9A89_011048 [Geosiphon pyriformis]
MSDSWGDPPSSKASGATDGAKWQETTEWTGPFPWESATNNVKGSEKIEEGWGSARSNDRKWDRDLPPWEQVSKKKNHLPPAVPKKKNESPSPKMEKWWDGESASWDQTPKGNTQPEPILVNKEKKIEGWGRKADVVEQGWGASKLPPSEVSGNNEFNMESEDRGWNVTEASQPTVDLSTESQNWNTPRNNHFQETSERPSWPQRGEEYDGNYKQRPFNYSPDNRRPFKGGRGRGRGDPGRYRQNRNDFDRNAGRFEQASFQKSNIKRGLPPEIIPGRGRNRADWNGANRLFKDALPEPDVNGLSNKKTSLYESIHAPKIDQVPEADKATQPEDKDTNTESVETGAARRKLNTDELEEKMARMVIVNEKLKAKHKIVEEDEEKFKKAEKVRKEQELKDKEMQKKKLQEEEEERERRLYQQNQLQAQMNSEREANAQRKIQNREWREWDQEKSEPTWDDSRAQRNFGDSRGGFGRGEHREDRNQNNTRRRRSDNDKRNGRGFFGRGRNYDRRGRFEGESLINDVDKNSSQESAPKEIFGNGSSWAEISEREHNGINLDLPWDDDKKNVHELNFEASDQKTVYQFEETRDQENLNLQNNHESKENDGTWEEQGVETYYPNISYKEDHGFDLKTEEKENVENEHAPIPLGTGPFVQTPAILEKAGKQITFTTGKIPHFGVHSQIIA